MTDFSAPVSYLDELRPAFVAHLADRLNNIIWSETQIYADRVGIKAPLKTHSAILFLLRHGPASLSEIARVDGQSHQLLASRIDPLERIGFVERFADPKDARRVPYRLTKSGLEEAARVEAAIAVKAEAMRRLFAEMDVNLIAIMEDAIERLRIKPLGQRLVEAALEGKPGRVQKENAPSRCLRIGLLAFVAASGWFSSSQAAPNAMCPAAASDAPALSAAKFDDGPLISQTVLLADFDGWISALRLTNPDLSIRADLPAFDNEIAIIRRELTKTMTRREAWLHFSKLNPFLHDAHGGIQMPDYREALEAHLKSGGHVVPFEVRFANDGSLRIFKTAPGLAGVVAGDRIVSVDGYAGAQMVADMMQRAIGDTPAFQRAFVERRFAMLFYYLYGDSDQYDVVVKSAADGCTRRIRSVGGTMLPEALQSKPGADELFETRILPSNIGYIRVDAFDSGLKDTYVKFTQDTFASFKTNHVRAIIIDVRENGGGDDPLWEEDLVDHFTTKPYAQLSHYVTRVTKDNADPGDVVGTLQSADYDKRFTPPATDPIRFSGPVYILGGPYSYSSTIQFMVAAQDFKLAKIAGEETAALSCQTGQVKRLDMPWTGLSATTPVIAYTRPSGQGCKRGVMPDVPVAMDEIEPANTLNALAAWIDKHTP